MSVAITVFLAVSILMPLAYGIRLLRLAAGSRLAWLIVAADSTVFIALIFLVGRWDIAGHHTRLGLLALFAAALLWSLRAHWSKPWRPVEGELRGHRSTLLTLALFSAALLHVLHGMLPPASSRELAFPLEGGRFVAVQAGSVALLNHHAGHPEQRFAVDITALNAGGWRARGILPATLDDYAIFGATVVSPCAGEVLATRADLPDLVPPERDPENAAGNHVVLDCGEVRVELAHFMQGGIAVAPGDTVAIGDALGRVGNSGNTTEPHLHVHAFDPATGMGVPMTFDGRFPVRNSLFER